MNRSALIAFGVFLLICGGVGFTAVQLRAPQVALDPDTLCPTVIAGHVLVLVDGTDPWSQRQVEALREGIARTAKSLRAGEKLTLFEIPAVLPVLPKAKFAMCSPGTGSEVDPLVQGSKVFQERFDKHFMAPLDSYIATLSMLQSAPTTPLLEVLKAVSEREDFSGVGGRRRIVIASDLLENASGYSHYRASVGDYASFETTPRGRELKPDLSGVDITIWYLPRVSASAFQGSRHLQWWKAYFRAAGGTVAGVEPLE